LTTPGEQSLHTSWKNDYDVASYFPEKYIDIFIHEEKLPEISKLGYHFRIVDSETKMKENIVTRAKDIYGYRTYDDMNNELHMLALNNPGLITLTTIGESRGKEYATAGNSNYNDYQHDIWCVKLSHNVMSNEDEPNIIFDGEHHAREPISMEMTMLILNYLVIIWNRS